MRCERAAHGFPADPGLLDLPRHEWFALLERRKAPLLQESRRARRVVLHEVFHDLAQGFGRDHLAYAPARHRPVLGKSIAGDDPFVRIAMLEKRRRQRAVASVFWKIEPRV